MEATLASTEAVQASGPPLNLAPGSAVGSAVVRAPCETPPAQLHNGNQRLESIGATKGTSDTCKIYLVAILCFS